MPKVVLVETKDPNIAAWAAFFSTLDTVGDSPDAQIKCNDMGGGVGGIDLNLLGQEIEQELSGAEGDGSRD